MTVPRRIGIVGLGLMGSAFAHRLFNSGFAVTGFDIDAGRRAAFEKLGASAATSIGELAQQCDPIVISVFDTAQVEEVLEAGLMPALKAESGRTVICTSTCDPDLIASLAERVRPAGIDFLEMPISGTSEQVRRGEAVGLIGGEDEIAAHVADVLDAMVAARFHVGRAGDGGRTKLAVNLILGLNRLALAEGLVFAERIGLDPQRFLEVARRSASYSQVMDTKGSKMVRGDFSPEGRVRQTLKDLHLMLDQARKAGQQLPLAVLNAEVLEACVRNGEADFDNSAVILEIRRRVT